MKNLKVAAICMHCETGEIEKNLNRTESFVSQASHEGVHIICFPELSISGYVLDHPGGLYSRATSDAIIARIEDMARSHGIAVLAGMIEMTDDKEPYITHVVATPYGHAGLYRKTHLSPHEMGRYRAGKILKTFSHEDTRLAIELCYESHFPEISTVMALRGAEVIFIPHASPRGDPEEKLRSWLRHLPGRAFDNAVFVVACNQVGMTRNGLSFPGGAVVINPAGKVICRYEGRDEQMVLAELKREELLEMRESRMKYFIPHRRPELYKEIAIIS